MKLANATRLTAAICALIDADPHNRTKQREELTAALAVVLDNEVVSSLEFVDITRRGIIKMPEHQHQFYGDGGPCSCGMTVSETLQDNLLDVEPDKYSSQGELISNTDIDDEVS